MDRRSLSPGTAPVYTQIRKCTRICRDELQVDSIVACDAEVAHDMECLRQRAEHMQQQLVQGEEDSVATEAESISMLTQSQSQDVEARNCDEQARDRHIIYAQNHQMGRGMSLLQRATHDAEEDAVQEEILAAHIE